MSSATRIITAVRGLRDEAGFAPEEADAIGVAAAEVAEAAADRMLIRLGAWTLGVVLGVGLRGEAGFEPEEAEAIGLATVEVAEAAADRIADRMLIRLGAWTLGVVLGVVSIATAIIIAVIRLSFS